MVRLCLASLLVAFLSAGLAGCIEDTGCPGHWHSSMDVVVNGEPVSFDHAKYTIEGNYPEMPMRTHLHREQEGIWHWEPEETECIRFAEVLPLIDMELSEGRLALTGTHEQLGQAGTFTDGGGSRLALYVRSEGGNWSEEPVGSVLARQQGQGERLLIIFGTQDADEVHTFQQAAENRTIPGGVSQRS